MSFIESTAKAAGLVQVRDSLESLFAKEYIPLQSQFIFRDRAQSGGRINWRQLMNVDLDRVVKEIDLSTLETLLSNITFANLERDDIERLGDAHFVKLFRVAQMTIEYLLYTQDYFQSVNKVLDTKGREWHAQARELQAMLRSKAEELKALKKELKIKQKTLGTYEYLMRLPPDQEQNVIKCRHCPKFFLAKSYLQKHYQRHHPQADFFKEFAEDHPGTQQALQTQELQTTVNQRLEQMAKSIAEERDAKTMQEEKLFEKIRSELFTSLADNFRRVESELAIVKVQKVAYEEQIALAIRTLPQEQPAKAENLLSEEKRQLEAVRAGISEDVIKIRESVQNMIGDAMAKRSYPSSGEGSSNKAERERLEKQVKQIEENYKAQVVALMEKTAEQEREIEERRQRETEQQRRWQEEEKKLKADLEKKLKEEVEKARAAEQKKSEELIQAALKANIDKSIKEQQEEAARLEKQRQIDEEQRKLAEQQKLLKEAEEARIKQEEAKKKAEEDAKRKADEDAKQKADQEAKIKAEQEAKKKAEEEAKKQAEQKARKEAEEAKQREEAKRKEEEQKKPQIEEVLVVEEEEVEEEVEEPEESKIATAAPPKPKLTPEEIKAKAKDSIKRLVANEANKYVATQSDGQQLVLKSMFDHPEYEVRERMPQVKHEIAAGQDLILKNEFESLKIAPPAASDSKSQLSSGRSRRGAEALENVNEQIKGLPRAQLDKVNNSLAKRLSDQSYQSYSKLLDGFLKSVVK